MAGARLSTVSGLWRSLVAHLTGGQGVASSNLASPTKPMSTPSDLIGAGIKPMFLPPSITPSDGRSGPARTTRARRRASVQHGLHIGMQAASRDCRILMSSDPCRRCSSMPASAIHVRAVCRRPWRTRPGCPSSVTSASQPVASRKVAVVITPPGDRPPVVPPVAAGSQPGERRTQRVDDRHRPPPTPLVSFVIRPPRPGYVCRWT